MLSTVLKITSILALGGGIALFVFKYEPVISEFWDWIYSNYFAISDTFPDWLLPYIPIPLLLGAIGLLIKLL